MNFTRIHRVRAPRLTATCLATVALAMTLAGCGKDTPTGTYNPPPSGSTTYTGSTTGPSAGDSGTLSVTIATSTPAPNSPGAGSQDVTATGTFTPAGGLPITLTGAWTDANELTLTGTGGWSFTGGVSGFNGLVGTFTGPGGLSGDFSLFVGSSSTVTVIVGTFAGTSSGAFNFSISGTEVHGKAWKTGSVTSIPLDGFYNGSTGHVTVYLVDQVTGPPYLAEGDYVPANNPDISNGVWNNNVDESGTWMGNKQ